VRPSHSSDFAANLYDVHQQLRRQGVELSVIQQFEREAYDARTTESGQVEPINKGAGAIGAEVHWLG
jgi:hypothetical protein